MQTGTPEAYLATLVRRLKTVDAATTYLEEVERSDFRDDLHRAVRDCQMTGLLYDHTVVAIAGDQGAGKTRLMRLLYDLDTAWLGDNAGRGEYLPVLVLEDPSIVEVHGCIYRWNDETNPGEPRGEAVTAENFQKAVRNWMGDVLELPVLRVPERYFGGHKNRGFLLLPGYERITAKNRPWQDFMRLALVASTACVLVTNGGLLAQQQDAIRTDLQKNQLAGVQPVIAITGTETMSADRQEQLRATAAERFQVPLSGVVCTGIGDPEYEKKVRTLILNALSQQGGVGLGARQRQLEDLEELSLQIGTVVSEARQAVRSSRDDQPEKQEIRLDIMEYLDKAIEAARGEYKRSLEQKLDSVEQQALKIAKEDFDETETGWGARLRDLKDFVTMQSDQAEDRMHSRLQSALDASGGGAAFAPTHAALLADLSRQKLVLPELSDSLITPGVGGGSTAGDDTVSGQLPASLKALQGILSHRRDRHSAPLTGQDAKELKQAVQLLPAIATSYMSVMQSAVAASAAPGKAPTTDLRAILQDITQTTVEMHGLTKPLLKAAASVLALDVAMDGEIDSIPAFVKAITTVVQGPDSTAGAPAMIATGPVGMALGAAVLAYGVISSLEKQQAKGRAHVSEAINSSFREQKMQYLAHFDEMMSWVARRVSDQLEVVLGLDESLGNRFRATLAINDLRNAQTSFLDEMRGRHT